LGAARSCLQLVVPGSNGEEVARRGRARRRVRGGSGRRRGRRSGPVAGRRRGGAGGGDEPPEEGRQSDVEERRQHVPTRLAGNASITDCFIFSSICSFSFDGKRICLFFQSLHFALDEVF